MRLVVIFDLPVKTKTERKAATSFRSGLIKDGFYMIQYSVYARICNGHNDVNKHMMRIDALLPSKGSVRALTLTEQQYGSAVLLLGCLSDEERAQKEGKLVIF